MPAATSRKPWDSRPEKSLGRERGNERKYKKLSGVAAHYCSPRSQEAEAEGAVSECHPDPRVEDAVGVGLLKGLLNRPTPECSILAKWSRD